MKVALAAGGAARQMLLTPEIVLSAVAGTRPVGLLGAR